MNNICFFIAITTIFTIGVMKGNAQSVKNYESDWKSVEAQIQKGLPASALDIVKKIYTKAKADKQDAQIVKALVFMTTLQQENREDNETQSIKQIEKELTVSKEPVSSLLNSYLAGIYQQYYNRNRYKLYTRTNTVDLKKDDIATWTTDDFHRKISEHYLASIKNESVLQKTILKPYDALISKGNVRYLRPTLYDLLAQRALNYFKNDERDIRKPAYAFQISGVEPFASASEFIMQQFVTKDSLSLQHKALLIYQNLLRFHLNDAKPDALIDVDISRLEFVRNSSLDPEKDQLYYNTLKAIHTKYPGNPAADQARYLMAEWHWQKGTQYDANGDTTHRYELLKAKDLVDKILDNKKESEGYVNAYNLNHQLLQPHFGFEVEKVNIPELPFRMLMNYKNIDKIYLRIIPATETLKNAVRNFRGENKYWNQLETAAPYKNWMQQLPKNTDLQNHRAEIKVDGLPSGEYFIVASANNDFSRNQNILAMQLTYISNISYVNHDGDFFVLHRNSGQPLANAKVQVWQRQYNYQTYKYTKSKFADYTSDKNGYFKFLKAKNKENRSGQGYIFEITHGKEKFFMDDEAYNYYFYDGANNEEVKTNIFLFTDRSLYRPGQTVYFKGIAINRQGDGEKADVYAGYKTTIFLFDANNQRKDSIKVAANEYGSFNGKFTLPQSGLNGVFYLRTQDNIGNSTFRMEEYKRPKFYVDYEKMKGTYKVNEEVEVTGIAKAYAGNNIEGAMVKYRVVRQARFPYPWLFRGGWWPRVEQQEIAHGETTTEAGGKFTITFKALPDLTVNPKLEPVFDYKISADVTDLNGEVRSGEETVSVGYKSLLLKVNIPDKLLLDSMKTISVRTENMAGNFEKANVSIVISKLKPEQRLLRPRFWQRPDQFVITKAEYIQNFPNDTYDNESDPKSWPVETKVLEQSSSTDSTGKFALNKAGFEPGFYVIETSTKDKDGNAVTDKQYVELYGKNQNQPGYPQYLSIKAPDPIEPGEKTEVKIGTGADDLFVVQGIEKPGTKYNFLKLNHEIKTNQFGATESERGGYGVTYMFVKHNRIFQSNQSIAVPWTNKDLKVEYSTFRDKTLPGSEEKWTVKISGYKNEKVSAEMLASMYDASLDQFYPHQWHEPSLWYNYYNNTQWNSNNNFASAQANVENGNDYDYKNLLKIYDQLFLNQFDNTVVVAFGMQKRMAITGAMRDKGVVMEEMASAPDANVSGLLQGKAAGVTVNQEGFKNASVSIRGVASDSGLINPLYVVDGVAVAGNPLNSIKPEDIESINVLKSTEATAIYGSKGANGVIVITTKKGSAALAKVETRKNFNETAFFFPDLKTDKDGNISFSFTMPEALTKWKFQALAHSKDLAMAYSSREIVTQKDLMVQPNTPRFLREGDQMEFSSKIVNLSAKEVTGIATLQLFDAATNKSVDGWFKNTVPQQTFTIAPGSSQAVKFPIEVPDQFNEVLTWRITAKTTGNNNATASLSDGEESMLPVLTNRMLVTETLPLHLRGTGTKNFSFDKLLKSEGSKTLTHHALTVEYTSNPAWYAVQALPYMMQYPFDCAEQTWNRYYSNSLATLIANGSPKIAQVFEKWRTSDTAELMSNLEKNQELKTVLLEETPWVMQAKSEAQQKKNIALLFDLVKMSGELSKAYDKLRQMQSPNGGFVWFKGGPDDRFITQYIITGIGHLKKLKAVSGQQEANLNRIVQAALPYLDLKVKEEYNDLVKHKTDLNKYTPSYFAVQYLYMRSFFPNIKIAAASQKAVDYFTDRGKKTWVQQNKYMQAMLALALHRGNDAATPKAILKSLKETSINNEELGMYYKDNVRSWWWYDAPIERQALITEAFEEAGKDSKTADDLRTWLLKNKQTNHWESTKATAEAIYVLLLRGSDWLEVTPDVTIQLGNIKISSQEENVREGTGYMKKIIVGEKVKPNMGNISVAVSNASPNTAPLSGVLQVSPNWGAVYWQYFEALDKITFAATPLSLNKKLFIESNTDQGPILKPINDGDAIKIGDKVKVRIELRADRDMEYVHMKDMRASAFEPSNVLSSYKWQGGLGYYESSKDASTNFFFGYLPKGTYVFEYSLFATVAGNFSNGVTTIQCMYAPEFTSHSEGIRVNVR